jgi:hypothetical protein
VKEIPYSCGSRMKLNPYWRETPAVVLWVGSGGRRDLPPLSSRSCWMKANWLGSSFFRRATKPSRLCTLKYFHHLWLRMFAARALAAVEVR